VFRTFYPLTAGGQARLHHGKALSYTSLSFEALQRSSLALEEEMCIRWGKPVKEPRFVRRSAPPWFSFGDSEGLLALLQIDLLRRNTERTERMYVTYFGPDWSH
jgi:hypothetical protein